MKLYMLEPTDSDAPLGKGARTPTRPEPAYAACRTDVQTLVRAIPKDSLKALLGDHIRVTVTRDGLTAEEYDHD